MHIVKAKHILNRRLTMSIPTKEFNQALITLIKSHQKFSMGFWKHIKKLKNPTRKFTYQFFIPLNRR